MLLVLLAVWLYLAGVALVFAYVGGEDWDEYPSLTVACVLAWPLIATVGFAMWCWVWARGEELD